MNAAPRTRGAATLAAALLAGACASALPPPGSSPTTPIPAGPADPAAAARHMEQGDRSWQQRPDTAAVAAARDAYLAAAGAAPTAVEPLVGAVRALVWLADHETDSGTRRALAADTVRVAQECERRNAASPACPYWLAIALGVQADAERGSALDGVKRMVALLRQAIEADATQDHAGPHRVLARVLANAPGWPSGPGDPDEAVVQARLAVRAFDAFAPNWLALGEAQREAGDAVGSRRSYERARELAQQATAGGHPDAPEWLADAEAALAR